MRRAYNVWRGARLMKTTFGGLGIREQASAISRLHNEIPVAMRQLLDDTKAWIAHKIYPSDEIAERFHHRLVRIHPFPNGNGRHSRLMDDLLAMQLGRRRFT